MLGDNIKSLRRAKGFTQEDLAEKLHVTRQTVSKWEKGYSVPDADLLAELADVLDVDVVELLGKPKTEDTKNKEDEIVQQLARLNEQLAVKNRKTKIIWRTVIIIVVIVVALNVFLAVHNYVVTKSVAAPSGSVSWTCGSNDETSYIDIEYDEKYHITSWSYTPSENAEYPKPEGGHNANRYYSQLKKYYADKDGCHFASEKGMKLAERK